MKITLTFDMDDESDVLEWEEIYKNSKKNYLLVENFENYLRHDFKYREMNESEEKIYEEICQKYYSLKKEERYE